MCTPSIWPQNSYLWGVNFLKYFSASALIKTFWGPKFVLVLIYWSPKCPISFSCHFLRFIDVMGFHMNYPVGSLYTLLSPHTFFHESSIWGNPGLGGIRMFGQRPKRCSSPSSSHNNKTDLASTLPLDNNVTRKNGVLREAPLTEAGGSWKHIWWNIQKKLSVFCSIIRFHSTYLAVVNEHDSSMVFSSTQQIFLWRCITVQCPAFFPLCWLLSQALIFGWPVHWSNLAGQVHWSNV